MENGKLKPGYHGVSHFDIDALEAIASEHDKRSETVSKKTDRRLHHKRARVARTLAHKIKHAHPETIDNVPLLPLPRIRVIHSDALTMLERAIRRQEGYED
jgi:hypothetical protein